MKCQLIGYNLQASAVPALDVLHKLVDALAGAVAIAILAGGLLSVGAWVLGHRSGNYQASDYGKNGVIITAVAAVLLGLGPTLINWLILSGQAGASSCAGAP
jgi:di/tricarboxylate transporter